MAVRFDASTDALSRTTTLPAITTFSMLAWVYPVVIVTGTGVINAALSHGVSSVTGNFYAVGTGNSTRVAIYNGSTITYGASTIAANAWIHLALTVAGTGSNQEIAYLNGVQELTATASATPTAQKIYVGNSTGGDPFNGRLAAVKIYSAVLTADEIKLEMRSYMPVRTANLNTWSPLLSATALENLANTGAWTTGGTLTTEDGPPLPWGLAPVRRSWHSAAIVAAKAPPPFQRPWRVYRRKAYA